MRLITNVEENRSVNSKYFIPPVIRANIWDRKKGSVEIIIIIIESIIEIIPI